MEGETNKRFGDLRILSAFAARINRGKALWLRRSLTILQGMKWTSSIVGSVAFAVVWTGCATADFSVTNVKVNSFCDPSSLGLQSYYVLPGNPGETESDFQFQEAKSYLEPLLRSKGFQPATTAQNSEILITLSYGLGVPQTYSTTTSVPVYGQTAGGIHPYNQVSVGANGPQVTSGTIYQQPSYGVVGQQTRTDTHVVIPAWVRAAAIDTRVYLRTRQTKAVWDTQAVVAKSNGDLRSTLPIMLAAAKTYLAGNSGQFQNVALTATQARNMLANPGL